MKNLKIKFKSLYFTIILLLGVTFYSCQEIVELDPFNQVAETIAFSDSAMVDLSVTGLYNAAQRGFFNGTDFRGYPFGSAFVQQGDARGEDAVNLQAFYRFTYEGTYDATTANNVFYWQDTWRLINRCNIIIEGVRDAATKRIISQARANVFEAEARLLRAASYHELLIHFARPFRHTADGSHQGVPWHETAYNKIATIESGYLKGRESVAFIYGKILADLDYAETNLLTKDQRVGNSKITRATKGAAAAYKIRIYQHMYNWPKVIEEGQKFLTGGAYVSQYSLGAEPWTCFVANYTNNESIFGMENSASNNPGVNAALASQYKRRELVAISPIVWRNKFWREDDKRRGTELVRQRVIRNSAGTITSVTLFTEKYKDDVNYTDASPMMRFAEVILNIAEAYARQGQKDLALGQLNRVRNRALANPATQAYVSSDFADHVAVLEAILAERRIELNMEGRRWPDIHRLQQCPHFPINGIPAKVANADPIALGSYSLGTEYSGPYGVLARPYTEFRFVWPIPLAELNANPTLAAQQNPGW